MYCPICGDEYREGITRCPEHDVELVAEPPELEETASFLERLDERIAIRAVFIALLVATVIYALSGIVTSTFFALIQLADWEGGFDSAVLSQNIQSGAFAVGVGALGCLAGAVLLRAYLAMSGMGEPDVTAAGSPDSGAPAGGIGAAIMRLLFAHDPFYFDLDCNQHRHGQ
jgi:hypothetical protein